MAMKAQLPAPTRRVNHEKTNRRTTALCACSALLSLLFIASTAQALNHRPTISSIPNQSQPTGTGSSSQFYNPTFFASDDLTTINVSRINVSVYDPASWYTGTITVTDNLNGSFTLSLSAQPTTMPGMATVTIKVTDASNLSISTSFTLQKYSGSA